MGITLFELLSIDISSILFILLGGVLGIIFFAISHRKNKDKGAININKESRSEEEVGK